MFDFLNPLLNRHPEKFKANVEIYTWATCPFVSVPSYFYGGKGLILPNTRLMVMKWHEATWHKGLTKVKLCLKFLLTIVT